MKDARNRLKNAELLSLIGACMATGAIALFLQSWLEPFRLLLLLGGLAVHAAAMYYRHRLERAAGSMPTAWERWLYWSCWLILAILAFFILAVGPGGSVASQATGSRFAAQVDTGVGRAYLYLLNVSPQAP